MKRHLDCDLTRFVDAQERVYDSVVSELGMGTKIGHWMWYIFPQLKGLGSSSSANYYGIRSLDEAKAFLVHPVLGTRLFHCTRLVNAASGKLVDDIFPYPDNLKFRSCMTLFEVAAEDAGEFAKAISTKCGNRRDLRTLEKLEQDNKSMESNG